MKGFETLVSNRKKYIKHVLKKKMLGPKHNYSDELTYRLRNNKHEEKHTIIYDKRKT